MFETGNNTKDGFLPAHPSFEGLMKRAGMNAGEGGWDALNAGPPSIEKTPAQKELEDIQKCYAQFAATPGGQRILEDLLNRSLRRGCSHPDANAGIEQEALFSRERRGENGFMCYILMQIKAGQSIKPAKKKK